VSLFVDSSALLKLYLDEPERDQFNAILEADAEWVTARITRVEVRRAITRMVTRRDRRRVIDAFESDWRDVNLVELTAPVVDRAVALAEGHGVRTLDALQLAAADLVGRGAFPFVTFDQRQARVARDLGWLVLGA